MVKWNFSIDFNKDKEEISALQSKALFQMIGYLKSASNTEQVLKRSKEEIDFANELLGYLHSTLLPILKENETKNEQ